MRCNGPSVPTVSLMPLQRRGNARHRCNSAPTNMEHWTAVVTRPHTVVSYTTSIYSLPPCTFYLYFNSEARWKVPEAVWWLVRSVVRNGKQGDLRGIERHVRKQGMSARQEKHIWSEKRRKVSDQCNQWASDALLIILSSCIQQNCIEGLDIEANPSASLGNLPF